MKKKKIILYGAGDVGGKYLKIFEDLNIEICCLIDSDENKQGRYLLRKKIFSINECLETYGKDNFFVITPLKREIEKIMRDNLLQNQVKNENIVPAEYVVTQHLDASRYCASVKWNKKQSWIFDTGETGSFGGIEKYTYLISNEFIKRGEHTKITFPSFIDNVPENLRGNVINFNFFTEKIEKEGFYNLGNTRELDTINFDEKLSHAVKILTELAPATLVLSNINWWFVAATIVNSIRKDSIQLISVIHGNEEISKRRNYFAVNYLKAIVCSNSGIYKTFLSDYNIDTTKVYMKNHPIVPCKNIEIKKYVRNEALKIGYAGRIEIIDKRCDLIPYFLEELDKRTQKYEFHILGDGGYKTKLQQYVTDNNYSRNVFFHKKIQYEEIPRFWSEMDIFINFSDSEGMCLSMIEAMQAGKPCVTTHVHEDVGKYVIDGKNGYVVPTGDTKSLAISVCRFIKNPNLVERYGRESYRIVNSSDHVEEYRFFLKGLVENE